MECHESSNQTILITMHFLKLKKEKSLGAFIVLLQSGQLFIENNKSIQYSLLFFNPVC